MAQELLKQIQFLRRDLGSLLFHFTQHPKVTVEIEQGTAKLYLSAHPRSVLEKIASEGCLRGSSTYIKGSYQCVCFTESPITEIAALFRLSNAASNTGMRPRYEPYGVAVKKEWLYERGGRPVIYQSDAEFDALPEAIRYRHVRYEPNNGIDFTWEREWRIKIEELKLEPSAAVFILPTAKEVFDFTYGHAKLEADFDRDDERPIGFYHAAKWLAVSLDFFGL